MDKTLKPPSLSLSPGKHYLVRNGKPFFWLADTWWYGATKRMKWPEPFKTLVRDRKKKGFSVIQIVVGFPPEADITSKEAKNSGGAPFDSSGKINHKYFDEVDKKISYMVEIGLVPCIVGGWGQHIDILGVDKIKELWQEIVARYSKYPVIFCLTGELDAFDPRLPANSSKPPTIFLAKQALGILPNSMREKIIKMRRAVKAILSSKKDKARLKSRIEKWQEIAEFIKKINYDKHLIIAHVSQKVTADNLLEHPDWLSIDSIQSGHSKDAIPFMVSSILNSKKMIINLEPWYEGILGNFNDYYQRVAFWLCILSGAKGHSYGAHGIWQMADNDNFMKHWGNSDWREAINFPGAVQLGKSVKFLQNYDWWKMSPDLSIVNPSFSSISPYNPVAAAIGEDCVFVYFPNVNLKRKFTLSLSEGKNFIEISWIDTRTLTTIKREELKNQLFRVKFPKDVNNKDMLCILSINK